MMYCQRILPFFVFLFTLSFHAGAQVPELINYQGRLVGTNGLVSGSVSLRLRIFDSPASGSLLYEDSNTVAVADGLYSTFIGDNTATGTLAAALAASEPYLEVMVNGVALGPRERIVAVAYARVAAAVAPDGSGSGLDADLLDGLESASFSQTNHGHDATYVNEAQASSISSAMIIDGTVSNADLSAGSVGASTLVDGAALSEIADDDGAGSGLDADLLDGVNAASFSQTNHNHDAAYVNESQTNSVTTQMITDGTLLFVDVGQNGAANGQVMKWNGSVWTAANDNAGAGGSFWELEGNTGLAFGTNFLGSADSNIVEFRVDNQTVMRYEPNLYVNIVGGHASNAISKAAYGATIGGGGHDFFPNFIHQDAHHSAIFAGWGHVIGTNAQHSGIGAGFQNSIGNNSDYGYIGGGQQNSLSGSGVAGADDCTIAGGINNAITGSAPHGVTISGGHTNRASGVEATIGGGGANSIGNGIASTVGGGFQNSIANLNSYGVIGGGFQNGIGVSGAGHDYSTIGGGAMNNISNDYATIPGGVSNTAVGIASFAAGTRAKALHTGAFVWGDNSTADISSTNNNSWTVRVNGGVRFTSGSTNASQNISWAPGAGSWSASSDRNGKENIEPVDAVAILEKVVSMPVSQWNYTGYPQRHIGPMAQDFHEQFALEGSPDTSLNGLDVDGVTIAAVQGLYELVQEQRKEIDRLREELDEIKNGGIGP